MAIGEVNKRDRSKSRVSPNKTKRFVIIVIVLTARLSIGCGSLMNEQVAIDERGEEPWRQAYLISKLGDRSLSHRRSVQVADPITTPDPTTNCSSALAIFVRSQGHSGFCQFQTISDTGYLYRSSYA